MSIVDTVMQQSRRLQERDAKLAFAAAKLRAEIERQGDAITITDVEASYIADLLEGKQ